MDSITHKRGDSFELTATIPKQFSNGYFAGWTVTSQIRKPDGTLVDAFDVEWLDTKTTRTLRLKKLNTKTWAVGRLDMDIQFVRDDGYTISSNTITLLIEKDVTGE